MPLRFAQATPESYSYPLLIGHLLDAAMRTSRDQEIVYRDRLTYRYGDFRGRIDRLANALEGIGAGPGSIVAVMDWDSHRYLECYFAIPMMGAVLQTVNVRLSAEQIRYTLTHAGAEILLIHRDFLPLLEQIGPCPSVRSIVLIDDDGGANVPPGLAGDYEALLAAAAPSRRFKDFDEKAIATLFYTTGTTGNPKAVQFSHRQIVLQALAANGPFGARDVRALGVGDVYMPLTPMFHVHAWGTPYVATMLGLKQVYPGRYEPDLLVALKERHGVSYSHCVPAILRMVLDAAERQGVDVAGWMMIIGGSALTPALCAEAVGRGMEIAAGYGMSETGPMVSVTRPDPRDETADQRIETRCRAGVPVPLSQVRIVDPDMNDVPADGETQGEIVLRTPWLTQSYVGDAAASAALWRGGWLHTQDVATIDALGYIRIRDRLKDVIKTGGEWVSSIMLEDLITRQPEVAEAAVIGVPCPKWGERPLAILVATTGSEPTVASVRKALQPAVDEGRISRFALPDRIETVDALPRTSVGKIDKKALRARFG